MANIKVRNLLCLIQKYFLKSFSTLSSSTSSSSSSSSFTVQYLINSCGLPFKSALLASQKLQIHENNLQNPQSVLQFLRSHHFNDTHLAKLIEMRPSVLHCRVENNLKPKIDFFIKSGFVGQLLPEFILLNPTILGMSLDSHIKQSLQFLKSVLDSNEKMLVALKRASWLLTSRLVQPNIDFLMKEGVPVDNIAKLILLHPRGILQRQERMVLVVNAVKNLGLQPETLLFTRGLRVMLQMSESTWKKKIEVMKSLGWSEEDIWRAFKRDPVYLSCSEEKLRIAIDFYVNTMKFGLQTIIGYPCLLEFSIDKRVRPRYNVLKVLNSQKLIKGETKMARSLAISEKNFFENCVIKYVDKVPGLLEIYKGTNIHT